MCSPDRQYIRFEINPFAIFLMWSASQRPGRMTGGEESRWPTRIQRPLNAASFEPLGGTPRMSLLSSVQVFRWQILYFAPKTFCIVDFMC